MKSIDDVQVPTGRVPKRTRRARGKHAGANRVRNAEGPLKSLDDVEFPMRTPIDPNTERPRHSHTSLTHAHTGTVKGVLTSDKLHLVQPVLREARPPTSGPP